VFSNNRQRAPISDIQVSQHQGWYQKQQRLHMFSSLGFCHTDTQLDSMWSSDWCWYQCHCQGTRSVSTNTRSHKLYSHHRGRYLLSLWECQNDAWTDCGRLSTALSKVKQKIQTPSLLFDTFPQCDSKVAEKQKINCLCQSLYFSCTYHSSLSSWCNVISLVERRANKMYLKAISCQTW
jgi:hypothetical protein